MLWPCANILTTSRAQSMSVHCKTAELSCSTDYRLVYQFSQCGLHLSTHLFKLSAFSPSLFPGVFGSAVFSSCPGVAMSFEPGDYMAKPPSDPPTGIYGHVMSGSYLDTDDSPGQKEMKVSQSHCYEVVHSRGDIIFMQYKDNLKMATI